MEDIHSGATGVGVPNHAEEEFGNVLVHVPIPDHKMEGETAVDWNGVQNQGGVTCTDVQVNHVFFFFFFFFFHSLGLCQPNRN